MTSLTDRMSGVLEQRAAVIRSALDAPERTPRTAVVVGRILGIGFVVVFLTGLYSHLLQHPLPWLTLLPTRPVELYQWTQGTHNVVGTALIPLVLAKLWIVYPRLFAWPPVRSFTDFIERASIAVLVATALLQLLMGVINTFQWYPWPFSFRVTHFALSWVIIGALLFHIGVKLPLIVRHWRQRTGAAGATDATGATGATGVAATTAAATEPAAVAFGHDEPAAAPVTVDADVPAPVTVDSDTPEPKAVE